MVINPQTLFFFDFSLVMLMVILSYLSKRLGEALKIKPYYRILYLTSAIIVLAAALDIIAETIQNSTISLISITLRFASSAIAFLICLIYWKWLFTEFLKN